MTKLKVGEANLCVGWFHYCSIESVCECSIVKKRQTDTIDAIICTVTLGEPLYGQWHIVWFYTIITVCGSIDVVVRILHLDPNEKYKYNYCCSMTNWRFINH